MVIEWIRHLGRSALRSKWAWQDRRLRAELIIELESKPVDKPESTSRKSDRPSPSAIMAILGQRWRDGENPGYYITDEYTMGLARSLPNFQYPLSRILIDEHGRREIESPNYAGTIHTNDGFKVLYYVPVPEPPPSAESPGFTSVTM